MITICYHNGALGNTLGALLASCTKEGGEKFPSFLKGQNLHHFIHSGNLYKIRHPKINLQYRMNLKALPKIKESIANALKNMGKLKNQK